MPWIGTIRPHQRDVWRGRRQAWQTLHDPVLTANAADPLRCKLREVTRAATQATHSPNSSEGALEVIEQECELPWLQVVSECLDQRLVTRVLDPQHLGNGSADELGVAYRRQVDEVNAVSKVIMKTRRDGKRQACFARPGRPSEGRQTQLGLE
jgi:hypothetical protein